MSFRAKGVFLAVLGSSLWGVMGVFVRGLTAVGYSSVDICFVRCLIAGAAFFILKAFTKPEALKIDLKGLIICAVYGICAYGISFVSYGIAVERIPVAVATVLMFMSPVWVSLLGALVFKEKVGGKTAMTIAVCIIGAAMVANLLGSVGGKMDILGIIAGVINGFGVALQIMVPRYFAERYRRDTMLVYGFLSAAAALLFISNFNVIGASFVSGAVVGNLINIAGIALLCTMVANGAFLSSTLYIDTTTSSILSALEVVVGAVVGFAVFSETLSATQIIGAFVVVFGSLGSTLLKSKTAENAEAKEA